MHTQHWKSFQLHVNVFSQQTLNKTKIFSLFPLPFSKLIHFFLLPSTPCPVYLFLSFLDSCLFSSISMCILLFICLSSLLFLSPLDLFLCIQIAVLPGTESLSKPSSASLHPSGESGNPICLANPILQFDRWTLFTVPWNSRWDLQKYVLWWILSHVNISEMLENTILRVLGTNTDPGSRWDRSQISSPGIRQSPARLFLTTLWGFQGQHSVLVFLHVINSQRNQQDV